MSREGRVQKDALKVKEIKRKLSTCRFSSMIQADTSMSLNQYQKPKEKNARPHLKEQRPLEPNALAS